MQRVLHKAMPTYVVRRLLQSSLLLFLPGLLRQGIQGCLSSPRHVAPMPELPWLIVRKTDKLLFFA